MDRHVLLPILLSGCALLYGCNSRPLVRPDVPGSVDDPVPIVIDGAAGLDSLLDPTQIQDAAIDGHVLLLDVQFSGGCSQHDFQAISQDSFAESLPVQLFVYLVHDANGDACEALVQESLSFDLSPIGQTYQTQYPQSQDPIILRLVDVPGHDVRITYDPHL